MIDRTLAPLIALVFLCAIASVHGKEPMKPDQKGRSSVDTVATPSGAGASTQTLGADAPRQTSGNPIIKHVRTADPSVVVGEDGTVWVYTSHDQDKAVNYNTMDGYRAFSSTNLVDWKDHGEILHSKDLSWGNQSGFMFAPDAVCRNGTWYLYFPHLTKKEGWKIGVATSKKPQGPFKDQGFVKGPKISGGFDPRCFIDSDGKVYLYWGSSFDTKAPMVARLKDTMMELAEEPRVIDYGEKGGFARRKAAEGIYMHKRKGVYYFTFSDWNGYAAMGDSPYGPFKKLHKIADGGKGAQDHHAIVQIKGQWYYFYHVGNHRHNNVKGSLHRRNVCVDRLYYNDDGTIKRIRKTSEGVTSIDKQESRKARKEQ